MRRLSLTRLRLQLPVAGPALHGRTAPAPVVAPSLAQQLTLVSIVLMTALSARLTPSEDETVHLVVLRPMTRWLPPRRRCVGPGRDNRQQLAIVPLYKVWSYMYTL